MCCISVVRIGSGCCGAALIRGNLHLNEVLQFWIPNRISSSLFRLCPYDIKHHIFPRHG